MKTNDRNAVVVALALAVTGCEGEASPCGDGSGLPDRFLIHNAGISVEVRREPYGYAVRDAGGKVVLETAASSGGGYGPISFATGSVGWHNMVIPGYYAFEPWLDPWHDGWKVVAADTSHDGELAVTLAEAAGAPRCLHVTHTLGAASLRVEVKADGAAPRAFAAAFQSPADEGFLGLGERFNRTEQRGRTLYSWPEEGGLGKGEKVKVGPANPFPNGEGMTYYPVPYFISTRGYAFWLDSDWRNQFELADPATGHPDRFRVFDIGPRLAYEVFVPTPGDPRPFPHRLLNAFIERTGHPAVAPPWAFGPRRRIDRGSKVGDQAEIQAMRDLDLAITVADDTEHFLPDAGETGHEAELAAWTKAARALGYRVVCYFNSLFTKGVDNPLHDEVSQALQKNWFLRNADGTPSEVYLISGSFTHVYQVDFTSPAATAWYQGHFQKAIDLGYSGWMYDFGEYVQPGTIAGDGTPGEALHNHYPVLYDRAGSQALAKSTIAGDGMFFARSGYTGSSQWTPIVWSGDPTASFEDALGLPAMVRGGVNMGLSGVPHWGSDIGGFKCIPDGSAVANGELLARWIELGAVSGDMHDENACAQGDGPKATIWSAPEAQAAWKEYARLHTRLFPYLYTLAEEAHRTGAPLMRHVFFEHPDRPDLASVDDAFYLGPALYAAPVVARGAITKKVTLPAGNYLDWRERTLIPGGATVTLPAPLDKLPLLLRDGYLVPLLDPTIDTLAETDNPDIIGPARVKDVYDVVGLLSTKTGSALFTLWDGGTLAATWKGNYADPALPPAGGEPALSTCPGCFLAETLAPHLRRVRISVSDGTVTAGGLTLTSKTGRRTRWDLYLVN